MQNKKYQIIELPPDPPEPPALPTDRQLDYAQKLGLHVPVDATKQDVSAMIDIKVNKDKLATDRHIEFARYFEIHLRPDVKYIGKKELFSLIFSALSENGREKDIVAWFAFRVYRHLVEGEHDVPIQSIGHPIILNIAEQLYSDSKIINSIRRYEGEKLIWFGEFTGGNGQVYNGGSVNTAAYKAVSALLKIKTKIPKQKNRASITTKRTAINQQGCLIIIVFAVLFFFYIKWRH
jgi:hypothetical protein